MSSAIVDDVSVDKDIMRKLIISAQYNGTIPASTDVLRYVVPIAIDFEAGLPLSRGRALVAPTADADFTIKKNGSSIGTIRFEAGSPTSVLITFASAQSFAVGDLLQITSPAEDATLADISFSLVGER